MLATRDARYSFVVAFWLLGEKLQGKAGDDCG